MYDFVVPAQLGLVRGDRMINNLERVFVFLSRAKIVFQIPFIWKVSLTEGGFLLKVAQ